MTAIKRDKCGSDLKRSHLGWGSKHSPKGVGTLGIETACLIARLTHSLTSVAQSHSTLSDPMNHSTPVLPVHHRLLESTQTHVHRVGDAIQPPHPLSSPSPAFNLFQHQGLFQSVSSSHHVAKVLELQLQHQSFQ